MCWLVCRIVYMVVAGKNMKRVWDLYKPGESPDFRLSYWILVFFGAQLFLSQVHNLQFASLLTQSVTCCHAKPLLPWCKYVVWHPKTLYRPNS